MRWALQVRMFQPARFQLEVVEQVSGQRTWDKKDEFNSAKEVVRQEGRRTGSSAKDSKTRVGDAPANAKIMQPDGIGAFACFSPLRLGRRRGPAPVLRG